MEDANESTNEREGKFDMFLQITHQHNVITNYDSGQLAGRAKLKSLRIVLGSTSLNFR